MKLVLFSHKCSREYHTANSLDAKHKRSNQPSKADTWELVLREECCHKMPNPLTCVVQESFGFKMLCLA